MKKLVPALLLALIAPVGLAQTSTAPTTQAPVADSAGPASKKGAKPTTDPSPSTATIPDTTVKSPPAKTERGAARRAKRAAKVGDKLIN